MSGSYIYAGTIAAGIWRRPLSEMVACQNLGKNNIPIRFSLAQNCPNPFKHTTAIEYQLLLKSYATHRVYNKSGWVVAALVKGTRREGEHRAKFYGTKYKSGTYLLRLDAAGPRGEKIITTARMVLKKQMSSTGNIPAS